MWRQNLLFFGLIGGGVFALGAGLMPAPPSQLLSHYDVRDYQAPDFVDIVRRVDASFRQVWAEQKLQPVPPAADLTVARRLALGLMSTIPSLEEIRQFEFLPEGQRLPWWIDHLLQDRRFADNFAERFARAFVGTEDGPFIFYRRRRVVAWLSEQFVNNRPYDQMVRDLIAADGLWTDQPATNFVSVTVQPDNANQPDPVRLAGRVTRAILGLRLDCAQCHNHPYADWKQADFQGLSAFFGQTQLGFTGIHEGPGEYEVKDRKTQEMRTVAPAVPFAAAFLPQDGSRRQRLACWLTHANNPYFARAAVNRVWALMLGQPLVEPVDNLESDNPAPGALALLAEDFAAHHFDLRRLIRIIACTTVIRLESTNDNDAGESAEKAWAVFPMTRLRPDQVVGSLLQTASVTTLNAESHILLRLARFGERNDFVKSYGDSGEDEFDGRGGTIPQRLLMMNGSLLHEKIKESPFNASTRIGMMAADDPRAIETAYLSVLTRRPTADEVEHFQLFLGDATLSRAQRFEDLFWTLLNSTEFSWNH